MAGMNKARSAAPRARTHEGARAMNETAQARLKRVLFAHMLFEDTFYLDGQKSADILKQAVADAVKESDLAAQSAIIEARHQMNIRHASLLAAVEFAKLTGGFMASDTIFGVIQRADEIAEVLAMAGGKRGMTHGIRKGAARAFRKFDEYQLAKYQGKGKEITLRDAVFLTHPNPKDTPLVQKIVDETLETPNTWETRLSSGEDKRAVFSDLLDTDKLGAMALLRNLRNMREAGVDVRKIERAMMLANWSRVLPFRFLSAAKTNPWAAKMLDKAFLEAVSNSTHLSGSTAVLVDTSASMRMTPISKRSTVYPVEAGAALAAAINGDRVDLYQWASTTKQVSNWGSMSTALNIQTGAVGHGTEAGQAVNYANRKGDYDRIILITDMQFSDSRLPALKKGQTGYTINISPYQDAGLMIGKWTHLTGWSDMVLKYIGEAEHASA